MPHVLVVDDSLTSRTLISALVAEFLPDATVSQAADAGEALAAFEQHEPDLSILDMNMPGLTGLQLAAVLRETNPCALLSMLTSNIQASTQEEAESLGIHFFRKPVSEAVIRQIIALLPEG